MPIAVGMYLPFGLATPILIGGLIAHFYSRGTTPAETRSRTASWRSVLVRRDRRRSTDSDSDRRLRGLWNHVVDAEYQPDGNHGYLAVGGGWNRGGVRGDGQAATVIVSWLSVPRLPLPAWRFGLPTA